MISDVNKIIIVLDLNDYKLGEKTTKKKGPWELGYFVKLKIISIIFQFSSLFFAISH